ncbi:MAG: LacI family DNA-binding transcriptional regulator [Alphaproteobacteria bacterium]|nr:LacI family DNA-binding transcriptional regulator [Alphaproteobacteria bacterium]
MPPARTRVTLKDVSKASGVSLITVSRALRRPETVHPDTRALIHRTIDELGYVPNLAARSLTSQRSDMVGVVVPVLTSSLFADFSEGIASVLRANDLQMLLGVSGRSVEHEHEAVRTFIARQADAIIVTGFTHADACRALLRKFSGPVIETWNLRDEAIDLSIGYSNFDAAVDMTRYLIGRGYREIAMVGGAFENNDQASDRHAGFLHAMKEAGLPTPEENVLAVPNPTTIQSGGELMMSLMRRRRPPDAVFFQAELPAQGAMFACLSEGIRIPADVAIAGFGDLSASALLPVPMTTIKIRATEIGECAARMVMQRLQDEPIDERAADIGYELKIRKSA